VQHWENKDVNVRSVTTSVTVCTFYATCLRGQAGDLPRCGNSLPKFCKHNLLFVYFITWRNLPVFIVHLYFYQTVNKGTFSGQPPVAQSKFRTIGREVGEMSTKVLLGKSGGEMLCMESIDTSFKFSGSSIAENLSFWDRT
jgi:hypothetical protein